MTVRQYVGVDDHLDPATAIALSEKLSRRAARDGNPADLDRAVEVLNRAVRDHGPSPELSAHLALCHQLRSHGRRLSGDPAGAAADLDAGIAACRVAGAGGNPWVTALHGELLDARAESGGDPADARAAAALLAEAATRLAGDSAAWRFWHGAANANRRLTGDLDALATAVRQLDRALAYPMARDELLQLHLERVQAGQHLIQGGRTGGPSLRDAVTAGVRALDAAGDADLELRATVALTMALGSLTAASADLGPVDTARVRRLFDLAERHPHPDARWQALVDTGVGILDHHAGSLDPAGPGDRGLARLAKAAASSEPDTDLGWRVRQALAYAGQAAAGETGDRRTGDHAREQADADPVTGTYSRLMAQLQDGDLTAAAATARAALPRLEAAGLSGIDQTFLTMVRALAGEPVTLPPVVSGTGVAANLRRAAAMIQLQAALTRMIASNDVAGVGRCADRLAEMVDAAGSDVRTSLTGAALAGQAHLEIAARATAAAGHARRAADWFGRARAIAGGVGSPLWPGLAMGGARALRLAGDPAPARELGLSALRAHAWQVFAQTGTDNGIASARNAAADARTVAGWCLADRDPDRLITALDAGRGLVLRATSTARVIADRLAGAGHAELADEWRATAGQGHDLVTGLPMTGTPPAGGVTVPDDLRLRVLRALGGDELTGYEPITAGEIRDGLRRAGSDALIYLLAGEPGRPGVAVIVPVTGRPAVLELPDLRPVDRAYAGANNRDLSSVAGPAGHLAQMCTWAWDAAMGEILSRLRRRPARIVLIPMGSLGLVPWHAAADRKHSPVRYAAQDAIISYSPSARAFCATAGLSRGAITSALIVGDPTGDLPFAGDEARAVHHAFYPDGSYLGRPAASGTPADVLAWIDTRPAGAATLNFACHGQIDPAAPADARLRLAGPADLTTRTLLERSQNAALNLQEVFLAACTTSVAGDDHDEVLSLASAFLAAGAATVFGSLWPVPDGETALLMFKIHQFLREDALDPADALHRAQLWMLDPARDTGTLPPELRRHVHPGATFPPAAWAGFIHAGR